MCPIAGVMPKPEAFETGVSMFKVNVVSNLWLLASSLSVHGVLGQEVLVTKVVYLFCVWDTAQQPW